MIPIEGGDLGLTRDLLFSAMRATDFEYRHQLLLHQIVVAGAVLTYVIDRDDIIWRFIKTAAADVRLLERSLFAVATIFFGVSACLCTWARAHSQFDRASFQALTGAKEALRTLRNRHYIGEFLYALGLASLVPLYGSIILIAGEAIRLLRLSRRDIVLVTAGQTGGLMQKSKPAWGQAFRGEAIKWGLFLTMIVFTFTLKDRVAEVLIGVTILLWGLLNLRLAGGSREVA